MWILLGFDDKGDDKGLILSKWQISLIFMGFWSEILSWCVDELAIRLAAFLTYQVSFNYPQLDEINSS